MSKESYKNKNKIVILNCQPLLLGGNYTEKKAWQLKFALSDTYFYEKIHWNKSVAAKVSIENLVRNVLKKTSLERKYLSQPFDNKSWYQKKN